MRCLTFALSLFALPALAHAADVPRGDPSTPPAPPTG